MSTVAAAHRHADRKNPNEIRPELVESSSLNKRLLSAMSVSLLLGLVYLISDSEVREKSNQERRNPGKERQLRAARPQ
jgi:hypothetical protein